MKAFYYNGTLYLRCIPAKKLFNSTMVHEVVNRGDVFAMDVATQQLTIIPGTAQVEHVELYHYELQKIPAPKQSKEQVEAVRAKLKEQRDIMEALALGRTFGKIVQHAFNYGPEAKK